MNPAFRYLQRSISSQEGGIILALIIMSIIVASISPAFISQYNLTTLILGFSFISIVSFGQTQVLISREIDLSVGSIAGFSGIVTAWLIVIASLPPFLAIVMGLGIGTFFGFLNGVLVAKVGLNSFIVTLGMMEAINGLILIITRGRAIVRLPESIFFLGRGQIWIIPVPVVIMIGILIYMTFILNNSVFGKRIYFIGGNVTAARFAGVNVEKSKITVFAISGLFAATAGILMVARLGSGQPTIGQFWLMPSIAAAVIGGTSLSGGKGSVIGTLAGAAILGVLQNAISILGISPYWERAIVGSVVILAVSMDVLREKFAYMSLVRGQR